MSEHLIHPFEPFFDSDSRVLILGTMPSPKSRQGMFYYGHPQNRFWKILPDLFDEPPLTDLEEKKAFLHEHHIALWDVLSACDIKGADDASIRNPVPSDLTRVLDHCRISAVFTNGQKASRFYEKFHKYRFPVPWYPLPSTSPANCRNWTYETLKEAYSVIRLYC